MNKKEALQKINELKKFVEDCDNKDELVGTYKSDSYSVEVTKDLDGYYIVLINGQRWHASLPMLANVIMSVIYEHDYLEAIYLDKNTKDYKEE